MLAEAHPLGAILYRKWHMYDMKWGDDKKIESSIICGSPFGGPVAMVNDPKKVAWNKDVKEKLTIFSSSGNTLAKIDWEDSNIVSMGWTEFEHLLVVLENGTVKVIDILGKVVKSINLLASAQTGTVIGECQYWGNGLAAAASDSTIYVAQGLTPSDLAGRGPTIYTIPSELGVERTYTCMAIIPPHQTREGVLEVLLATSDNSVVVVKQVNGRNFMEDQQLQGTIDAPIVKMALSANGVNLACYRDDGVLSVMTSSFSDKILDFDAKSVSSPIEIAWCGDDAVIMQWRNTGIVMVGPYGDWLNFPYDNTAIHLTPEQDCCRIFTNRGCEVLQRVLPATVSIRSVGSTDPAALMFDAMEAFEGGDPKSDENIRSIAAAEQLTEAVHACILAAAGEFDIANQQAFLKAASYGKAFCPDADPQEFVETAKILRVLNEIRKPNIGIPLTYAQYMRFPPERLIMRLISRNHHFLALRVCELLKMKNEVVLVHWACEKIRRLSKSAATDDEINAVIRRQLDPYGKVSYLSIAETAYSMSRRRLATFILDREQHPGDQIPLLLRMNEEELALQKAVWSEDSDLIYYTLLSLESRSTQPRGSLGVENFYRVVHSYPAATNLLKLYYYNKAIAPEGRKALKDFLQFGKNYFEAGVAAATQAIQQKEAGARVGFLAEASGFFSQSKEGGFSKAATDDEMELLETQTQLERRSTLPVRLAGLSLISTLERLTYLGMESPQDAKWTEGEIAKIVKRFKVNEKSLWHTRIRCYSSKGDWVALRNLAVEKKSPVGYVPFARACMERMQPLGVIEFYVDKITVLDDKYSLYMELRQFDRAVEVAAKLRDPNKLQEVGRMCKNAALERQIQEHLSKL